MKVKWRRPKGEEKKDESSRSRNKLIQFSLFSFISLLFAIKLYITVYERDSNKCKKRSQNYQHQPVK